jgi:tetratricopeptide (TPR) repeat protein/tRNA A-37 threonylcarbamoyl transferase component Bud32
MVEGALGRPSLVDIETHVDGCASCASVVAGLGALDPTLDYPALATVDPDHYVFVAQLASGGMGRIIRARDRRLGRDVALKENAVESREQARRFEREARITARLQHPSIVQVHEAGVWPGGEPFFAMQLVAGRSLDQVIAAATTLDARLALVPNALAVADAIAYAHSLGVIHRDLKPRNVIVGEFGETVVVDWGLAKDLTSPMPDVVDAPFRMPASPAEATGLGTVVGTPAYMPPEQARGEPVDQRADVYALGALLFHVLAGRPPVLGETSADVLATIAAGGAASLDEVEPELPADLLAIVAKAMASASGDRYPSARELARDLRQFQTGQLVSAHRYTPAQLVRRWLRRHRGAVTAIAGAALVLAAVGAISVRRIVRAEHVAETERHAAEQHRGDAEELMSFMLGDLRAKLQPIGKLDLLDAVATKAASYYEQRPDGTPADRRKRAAALTSLGDVLLARGHTQEALARYRAAQVIAERLVADAPDRPDAQRELSVAHTRIGDALAAQGDSAGALASYHADLAIALELAARAPGDPDKQRDVSVSHEKVADMLELQGRFADAMAELRASIAITERLAATAPSASSQRDLSVDHERLGEVLAMHEEIAAALVEQRTALVLREQLVARDPGSAEAKRDLAGSHHQVGELLLRQGDVAGGLASERAALQLDEALVARDSTNAEWRSDLALAHANLGKMLSAQHDGSAALAELRTALAIQAPLAAEDSTHADRLRDVEITRKRIGDLLADRGARAAALAEYRQVEELAAELATRDATHSTWQLDLAIAHEKLGQLEEDDGQLDVALADDRACLAIRGALAAKDPTNAGWQNDVAVAHYNLGTLLAKRDTVAALDEHRAALAITEQLVARDLHDLARRRDLADSHQQIGELLIARDRAAGRAELATAADQLQQLVTEQPDNARWRSDLTKLRAELAR